MQSFSVFLWYIPLDLSASASPLALHFPPSTSLSLILSLSASALHSPSLHLPPSRFPSVFLSLSSSRHTHLIRCDWGGKVRWLLWQRQGVTGGAGWCRAERWQEQRAAVYTSLSSKRPITDMPDGGTGGPEIHPVHPGRKTQRRHHPLLDNCSRRLQRGCHNNQCHTNQLCCCLPETLQTVCL